MRTRLDLLKPNTESQVVEQQASQKLNFDRRGGLCQFQVGQPVLIQNFCQGSKWVPGEIAGVRGPLTYTVRIQTGLLWKRHANHLKLAVNRPVVEEKVIEPNSTYCQRKKLNPSQRVHHPMRSRTKSQNNKTRQFKSTYTLLVSIVFQTGMVSTDSGLTEYVYICFWLVFFFFVRRGENVVTGITNCIVLC